MSIRDELQQLYNEHKRLTPELVVKAAESEHHPLHTHFEWDDRVAGESWRRHQAQDMIQSVKIVYVDDRNVERSVRRFHSVPAEEGREYRTTEDIITDPFMKELVLSDMKRDWEVLKRRWESFDEFTNMIKEDIAS